MTSAGTFCPTGPKKWQKNKHRQRNADKNRPLPKVHSDTQCGYYLQVSPVAILENFQRAVRNGYLPDRRVQSGIGTVEVRQYCHKGY